MLASDEYSTHPRRVTDAQLTGTDQAFDGAQADVEHFGGLFAGIDAVRFDYGSFSVMYHKCASLPRLMPKLQPIQERARTTVQRADAPFALVPFARAVGFTHFQRLPPVDGLGERLPVQFARGR